jgi:hypothetical protein
LNIPAAVNAAEIEDSASTTPGTPSPRGSQWKGSIFGNKALGGSKTLSMVQRDRTAGHA